MVSEEELIDKLIALEEAGQYDDLLYQANYYLKDNPEYASLYLFKGNALREKGELEEAQTAYRWAIMYNPNDIAARTNYASILYSFKDYVGALNAADAAILMNPEFPEPYLISGNVLSILGFPEQAMYAYHHAYEFMPSNYGLGSYVAELYAKNNEPEDAFKLLMQILKNYPENAALQLQMAVTLAFFMQNGVMLKEVDEFVIRWQKEFGYNEIVGEVAPILLRHEMNYTPLTSERLKQAFDSISAIYDDVNQDTAITFINMLENSLYSICSGRDDLRVLDVGCGTGMGAQPLREYTRFGELVGVDISSNLLEIAKSKNIYSKTILSDALADIASEMYPYDILIASETLSYFKDLKQAFEILNQKLTIGGMLFFSIKRNTLTKDDVLLYPPFLYIFSENYVRNSLLKNGFEIQSIQPMQDGSDENVHDKRYFYIAKKVKNT
ncbi:MAG: methyltransferase [Alphaproteobacteria bacterium]|nr:methyltransferase [Alphaproteobacteria bacterium]